MYGLNLTHRVLRSAGGRTAAGAGRPLLASLAHAAVACICTVLAHSWQAERWLGSAELAQSVKGM